MNIPVLFIAYSFPPISGPGVFRSLYFAQNLGKFGYKPIVLTMTEADIEADKLKTDPVLLTQLPDDIEIIRTPTQRPRRITHFFQKLRLFRVLWFVAYPWLWEYAARWPFSSLKPAQEAIKQHDIQLIYTTSGPFSSILLGYLLKRRTGLPWVIDIRDPFTDGYQWHWPSKFHWYGSRWMEKWLYPKADKVIVNTPEVKKLYLERNLVSPERITVVTNGF